MMVKEKDKEGPKSWCASGDTTLEATQGKILSQSPTDPTSGRRYLHVSWLKKPSIFSWVVLRVAIDLNECEPTEFD